MAPGERAIGARSIGREGDVVELPRKKWHSVNQLANDVSLFEAAITGSAQPSQRILPILFP
jgi:hypothetical protein